VGTVFPFGFADFPCFVGYDEQSSCIQSDPEMDYLEINQNGRIQVFLTVHDVRFSGGGCNYENSNNDQLNVATSVLNLKIEREEDTLKVNGKLVPEGGEFKYTKFWNLNPWTVYRLEIKNRGLTPVCGSSAPPGMYVSGSYGNDISLTKAGIVLLISIALVLGYLYFSPINETKNQNLPEPYDSYNEFSKKIRLQANVTLPTYDIAIMLSIPNSNDKIVMLKHVRPFRNILRCKEDGSVVWQAELPTKSDDVYTNANWQDLHLLAYSRSCTKVVLDLETGKIIPSANS